MNRHRLMRGRGFKICDESIATGAGDFKFRDQADQAGLRGRVQEM